MAIDIMGLIGQVVKFRARNFKKSVAPWETGFLESVDNQPGFCGGQVAMIRMKDKELHRIELRDYEISKR
jgi:hypothetical protein